MSNPPPTRPWFRLASIRSAPPPAPAPAPAPVPEVRPFYSLPTFRSTASAPSSPQTQPTKPHEPTPAPAPEPRLAPGDRASAPSSPTKRVVSAPSASLPTSPIQKAPNTNSSSSPSHKPPTTYSSPDKAAITTSPKIIKAESVHSPIHSPKLKPTAPPPSPLTLPPSHLKSEPKIPTEAEQKTVLVHNNIEQKPKKWTKDNGAIHREAGNHDNTHYGKGKESETKERGIHKKVSDSEDSGMKVITIAGENRGAYMELIQSSKKQEPNYLHKKGNSKINNGDGGESESSGSGEGNANRKDKNHKGRTTSSLPMTAYTNSNVQCINNSLLFHTSCSHHDPGVRLSLSKKPFGEGYHLKEKVDGHNT